MVQDGARWCKMVQDGARWCKIVQYHAIPCNTMQYHAIPCNTMQYHAKPCYTMQYHAISCNTMQYHAIQCDTQKSPNFAIPKKVPILLSSPKFHFDVFLDGYLLWKNMYFDWHLKYIWDKYIYYTLSSRNETLVFLALDPLRGTCVCSGHS